jgi:hypothetical protein
MVPNGDLLLVAGTTVKISGALAARQSIECVLSLFLGEFFLDRRKGLNYYRDVLVKNPNVEAIRSVIRDAILSVEGVVAVPLIEFTPPTGDERRAKIDWEAFYEDGTALHDVELPE